MRLKYLALTLCLASVIGCQSHRKSADCVKDGSSDSCQMNKCDGQCDGKAAKSEGHHGNHGRAHGAAGAMGGSESLQAKGFEVWATSANLTADEKSKLAVIHTSTGRDAMRIRSEIGKAKMEMFGELAKANYDKKKIDSLKKQIVKLDSERLDKMFKSLEEVEKLLGKDQKAREYFKFLETLEKGQF